LSVPAFEAILQGKVKPTHALLTTQSMRHPQGQHRKSKSNQLRLQLPQWYHPFSWSVKNNFAQ
jgi:hypothetical protein